MDSKLTVFKSLFSLSRQLGFEFSFLGLQHASGQRHQTFWTSNQIDQLVEESFFFEQVVVGSRSFHAFKYEQHDEWVRWLPDPDVNGFAEE